MKIKAAVLALMALTAALPAAPATAQAPTAVLSLSQDEHYFGKVTQGDQPTHIFEFTNHGHLPLIISSVRSSCSCIATDWQHQPIMPGETGTITVTFDSTRQLGAVNKTITIFSNAEAGTMQLKIAAVVEGKVENRQP